MHYTGNLDKFKYLHQQFKKAIEFQATVETMAYTICKTKPLAINAAQPTFNKICEKICSNIDLRDKTINYYIKQGIDFLSSEDKYLKALQNAAEMALQIDTGGVHKK